MFTDNLWLHWGLSFLWFELPFPELGRRVFSQRFFENVINEAGVHNFITHYESKLPFVDIGACVGKYCKLMRGRCSRIIAVEPDPLNVALLRRAFRSDNSVQILQVAVGTKNGYSMFQRYRDIGSGSLVPFKTENTREAFQVRVVTMDSIIKERVGLVKVDIEGAELDVIRNSTSVFSLVDNWIVEVHNPTYAVKDIFEAGGYRTRWLDEVTWQTEKEQQIGIRHILAYRP